MPIEYLGNKTRHLDFVLAPIAEVDGINSVADLFCGTASISVGLDSIGKQVLANDHLELCSMLARARLLVERPPTFKGLVDEVQPLPGVTMYESVLAHLNGLGGVHGYFTQTYSPGDTGEGRKYLTTRNARKLDSARATIGRWQTALSEVEYAVLLRDLVVAVTKVSNTAGTYGAYLKHWKRRSLDDLFLVPDADTMGSERKNPAAHRVTCKDVESAASELRADAAYLDPPYTKRQYAAYYHLLETLVSGEEPEVGGVTGLPEWERKRSDFCDKRRAASALRRLNDGLDVKHLFMSYSDEGHIAHEEVVEILGSRGEVEWVETSAQRFKSSALSHKSSSVQERVYHATTR